MNSENFQLSEDNHREVFENIILDAAAIEEKSSMEHPRAIILIAQPGSGRAGLVLGAREELGNDVVLIDPDELRDAYPQLEALRNAHPYTWSRLTQVDANQWAEELLDAAIEGRRNLIFDTTFSDERCDVARVKGLQARGYDVDICAMAEHRLESEYGVNSRFSRHLD